eukprot:1317728-Rhodomonas_salina.6
MTLRIALPGRECSTATMSLSRTHLQGSIPGIRDAISSAHTLSCSPPTPLKPVPEIKEPRKPQGQIR